MCASESLLVDGVDVAARLHDKYGPPPQRTSDDTSDDEGDALLHAHDAAEPPGGNDDDDVVIVHVAANSHVPRWRRTLARLPVQAAYAPLRYEDVPIRLLECLDEVPAVGTITPVGDGTFRVVRDDVELAVVADARVGDVLLRAAMRDPGLCVRAGAGAGWLRRHAWDTWMANLDPEAIA